MNIFYEEYSDKFDEEARRLVTIILKNAKRMGQLIDDLLAFSRLGRKELAKQNISMEDIIHHVWEEQTQMAGERHIELVLKEMPEAYVDSITIRQLWVNLVSNAIKYTRNKQEAVVEIGSEESEDNLIYYIRDNGAGFDMRYYDKLFGVFQRLHSDKEFEGTGVGLAIVQRIISKHGGKIWAEAKPNEGATFFFSLNKSPSSQS
jgi:light-regulated signal transduction histidine kinase (bacteriophytochrome)